MKTGNKTRIVVAKIMLLTLSWGNFQIMGLYFFVIFQVLYCILSASVYGGKLSFHFPKEIFAVLIIHFATCISGLLTDLPDSFKIYSAVMTFVLIPSYIAFAYLMMDSKKGVFEFAEIIKWIKIGFLVQIIYLPIQYILYKALGIDVNKIIFSNLFHFMENPSFIREGVWHPSAFTWHSAYLAPMLVLAFLLFKNNYIRLIILLDAFICGNTTALLGAAIAAVWVLLHELLFGAKSIKEKRLIGSVAIVGIIGFYLLGMGGIEQLLLKAQHIIRRISFTDSSSAAHLSYYFLYPKIVRNQSVFTILFGTGYASSGDAITTINGQYRDLAHWVVECDIMDILISRGVIGFLVYYCFLLSISRKGKKIDYKYRVAVLVVIIQGITYNVQFEYFFFIELIMCGSVYFRQNIFGKIGSAGCRKNYAGRQMEQNT